MSGGNSPASEQMKLLNVFTLEVYEITSKGSDFKTFMISDSYEQEHEYVRRLDSTYWEVFTDNAWYQVNDKGMINSLEHMRNLVTRHA